MARQINIEQIPEQQSRLPLARFRQASGFTSASHRPIRMAIQRGWKLNCASFPELLLAHPTMSAVTFRAVRKQRLPRLPGLLQATTGGAIEWWTVSEMREAGSPRAILTSLYQTRISLFFKLYENHPDLPSFHTPRSPQLQFRQASGFISA